MRDGDYYKWGYKELPQNVHDPYWCKSRIALARNGVLVDTYWGSGGDGARWTFEDAQRLLDLKFVANLDELAEIPPNWAWTYHPDDVVDLTHPNRGTCYIRKGAEPHIPAQIEKLEKDKAKFLRQAESVQQRIDYLKEQLDLKQALG